MSGFLWLPFVEDEREEGIAILEDAVDNSSYNHYLALYSLVWIYIDRGDYPKGVETAREAIQKFPRSRFFKWTEASALTKIDPRAALVSYEAIYFSLEEEQKLNFYSILMLKSKMAGLLYSMKEYKKVLKLCEEILSINDVPEDISDVWMDRYENVKKLKEDAGLNLNVQASK
jgi:tetratricopeptide (TPR) repeat protein